MNPNLILLVEIRYRDAGPGWLPPEHAWWKRDTAGRLVPGWDEGQHLQVEFANPEFLARLTARARSAVKSGILPFGPVCSNLISSLDPSNKPRNKARLSAT